eukprot:IDg8491t1
MDIATRMRLEEAREEVELDINQASLLEKRHRENEKAISLLPKEVNSITKRPVMMCLGKEAFLSLGLDAARDALLSENKRVWDEIETLQRKITKGSRELEEMEEMAQLLHGNP